MTCYDCAYLGFDRNEVVGMAEMCNHPGKWIPGAGFADSEHECEFFKKKSGVSNGIHIPKMKKKRPGNISKNTMFKILLAI